MISNIYFWLLIVIVPLMMSFSILDSNSEKQTNQPSQTIGGRWNIRYNQPEAQDLYTISNTNQGFQQCPFLVEHVDKK